MLNDDIYFYQILINYIYQQYDSINHRKLFLYELIQVKEEIMLNKKICIMLLLLTVSICAISTVSAVDNVTDAVAVDDAVINEDTSDEIDDVTNIVKTDVKNEDKLASPQNDSKLTVEESSEVLSASSAPANLYKINFAQTNYSFAAINGALIKLTIDPCKNANYNCYNFYIGIFKVDSKGNPEKLVSKSDLFSSDSASDRQIATYTYKIPAKGLAPGKYAIIAFNDDADLTPMAGAILNPKKVSTTVKANKVINYQGRYIKLKATVKRAGKNINEGTVTFKIKGKQYKVKVKNGVATKSVKMNNAGKFKYSATFSSTYYNTKKVYANAYVKKSYKTKIIVKNQKQYRSAKPKPFYVKVKANGKYVQKGKIKIIDTVSLKNGKAKFYYPDSDWNFNGQYLTLVHFKKVVTKTFTVKFIPASKIYQPSSKKIKLTVYYRCTACGSKTTHSHNGMYFIVG